MDLNELTPELFEKAEFAERRRGYDIDQVERFLEETGTAVAQLLVRHRQLEERAAHAELRLAETEKQLEQAGSAATAAATERRSASEADEAAEIEQATSTLLMAKRTADATISEAGAEAERIRADAAAGADRIVAEARATADAELAAGRDRVLEVVTVLEGRRDALGAVIEGFEHQIETYRSQIAEVAGALLSMTEDPEALAERPAPIVPSSAAGYVGDDPAMRTDSRGEEVSNKTEAGAAAEPLEVDLTDQTQLHDTATAAREEGGWSEGSWSDVSASSSQSADHRSSRAGTPQGSVSEPTVVVDAEPVTGQSSDRFLRELDEAVNESQKSSEENEEAMSAFFEGGEEDQSRSRFGWRR